MCLFYKCLYVLSEWILYTVFCSCSVDRDTLSPRPKTKVLGIVPKYTSLNGKMHQQSAMTPSGRIKPFRTEEWKCPIWTKSRNCGIHSDNRFAVQECKSCSSSSLWPDKTVKLNSEPVDLVKIRWLLVFARCLKRIQLSVTIVRIPCIELDGPIKSLHSDVKWQFLQVIFYKYFQSRQ